MSIQQKSTRSSAVLWFKKSRTRSCFLLKLLKNWLLLRLKLNKWIRNQRVEHFYKCFFFFLPSTNDCNLIGSSQDFQHRTITSKWFFIANQIFYSSVDEHFQLKRNSLKKRNTNKNHEIRPFESSFRENWHLKRRRRRKKKARNDQKCSLQVTCLIFNFKWNCTFVVNSSALTCYNTYPGMSKCDLIVFASECLFFFLGEVEHFTHTRNLSCGIEFLSDIFMNL